MPIEAVQRDYFPHIDVKKLVAKCLQGEIKLLLIRTDPSSQKSHKGVALQDLATYLDERRVAAFKQQQMAALGKTGVCRSVEN